MNNDIIWETELNTKVFNVSPRVAQILHEMEIYTNIVTFVSVLDENSLFIRFRGYSDNVSEAQQTLKIQGKHCTPDTLFSTFVATCEEYRAMHLATVEFVKATVEEAQKHLGIAMQVLMLDNVLIGRQGLETIKQERFHIQETPYTLVVTYMGLVRGAEDDDLVRFFNPNEKPTYVPNGVVVSYDVEGNNPCEIDYSYTYIVRDIRFHLTI